MQTQTQDEKTGTVEVSPGTPFGVYAVVKASDSSTSTLFAKTKKKLAQQIADAENVLGPISILGVFKGKQLQVQEKKAFNFN